jgi:DNA-binding response OmpR family regulator
MINPNILVVDDTPLNLLLLVDILSKDGYQVNSVNSGELALAAVKNNPPDLILLDIMMPDMDGYEVCEKLKENHLTQGIPIIFISALGENSDKIRAFDAGGIDYIVKPLKPKEVLARVRNHLKMLINFSKPEES